MTDEQMKQAIESAVWSYEPKDAVDRALRDALIKEAVSICHETGAPHSYVKLCADTIEEFCVATVLG